MKFVKSLTVASILLAFGSFSSLSTEGVNFNLEYRESDIGIDYRAIADPPLDVLLSHGEVEFLENATPVHGDMAVDSWPEFASEIAGGRLSPFTINIMREFTPNMLARFGLLDSQNPKFRRLWSEGSVFISEN